MNEAKFSVLDIVKHVPDCNWHPHSSVNRVCMVVKVFNGNCYEIVPIDHEREAIVYVCAEHDLEAA